MRSCKLHNPVWLCTPKLSAARAAMSADMLVPNAVSAEFFHTDAGTAFVDLLINGNRETWPIRSKRFRTWLRRCHYEITRTAASAAAIKSVLDLLEAQAQFEGPEREVRVRLAEHAGHTSLDLADEYWRAVEIGPDGWRVIGSPPCASAARRACCRCQSPKEAAPSRRSHPFSICPAETTLSWWWLGCWQRCGRAV